MITIKQQANARIPTTDGQFQLYLYGNDYDEKEHMALVLGEITGRENVLVRVHSECFTGDVLGSQRCDCGPQLQRAMQLIAVEGAGIIIYLRQEGRGIGLRDKLKAYNLQDAGYDTVDANLMLGHQADARDYTIAALILADLKVQSLRLLTNNPAKVTSLRQAGLHIVARVPLQTAVTAENAAYLQAKVARMQHLLQLPSVGRAKGAGAGKRPFVTLTYAQSLDGSITYQRGQPMPLSGPQSMTFTHALRAKHDGILVGIGTVLADDPRLTVRLVNGRHPQPIVLDSHLRLPHNAKLLQKGARQPWLATTASQNDPNWATLTAAGAQILSLPANEQGQVDLSILLTHLYQSGIQSLMIEGGATVITNFLAAQLVDRMVITITPIVVGGLHAVGSRIQLNGHSFPRLSDVQTRRLGEDLVISGDIDWK